MKRNVKWLFLTWKGSYTIESAVVISILFWILGALLLCGFYMHDKEILQSAACETSAAGNNYATASERTEAAERIRQRITKSRLLGSQDLNGVISTGETQASGIWTADYPIPGFAAKYFWENRLQIRQTWDCKVMDTAAMIRKIRGVGEFLTGGNP